MTTQSRFVPVGPSLIVRLLLGPSSKLLNPLVGRLAGRRFVPLIAGVGHVGRRSGRRYLTPTGAGMMLMPAGIILARADAILAVGAIVADMLYALRMPLVIGDTKGLVSGLPTEIRDAGASRCGIRQDTSAGSIRL